MRTLSVRVLGVFDVEAAELRDLGSRKARSLLRLLALARGRVVPTADLVEALWGTSPPALPADQVAVLASRLRRVLGRDRVEHADRGYRLRYDWLDADELAAVVAEMQRRRDLRNAGGAAATARLALSLVRADIPVQDDDPLWVLDEIAELQRLVSRARRLATVALLDAGSWLEAADLADGDLRRDPFDEEAVRLLMRANVQGGRPAMALAAYAAHRARLSDELGTDPAPQTEELHAAVLRGQLTSVPTPASATPTLVGRASQLHHLDNLVARAAAGSVQVAVVSGEPGIGKTTLLRAWAARRAASGDVVLSGSCGPLDRSIPLDALFVAIATRLRQLDDSAVDSVLGPDSDVLGPLLGLGPDDRGAASLQLAEGTVGPTVLFGALGSVLQRLGGGSTVVLAIDDAHLAGPALIAWLGYVQRLSFPLVVVAGRRLGEGEDLPAHDLVSLGPLDRAAAGELVGEARADVLYERSLGHPLFLSELASAAADELPGSLVAGIGLRCDQLGTAAQLIRAAAVIGPPIDLDLLSAVLQVPAVQVLDGIELAATRGLLVDEAGEFSFRHDLVRQALAADASSGRSALLHREAGRVLASRADSDPTRVAEHARLGGDLEVAARYLKAAAERAAERFDLETAERLLDESLMLYAAPDARLVRARIRTLRGRYGEALDDVRTASGAGAAALEVGAWASYFDRDFEAAIRFAHEGQLVADDPVLRARCLIAGGRMQHANGDLATAERLLIEGLDGAAGPDRVTAAAWLGVLRSHQSRATDALALLGPATLDHVGVEQTSATLHALLFTGHAQAVAGRPVEALAHFTRYTAEVERRHMSRFVGRGVNFGGWVLRNTGDPERAVDGHLAALDLAGPGTRELRVAALEDLAEDRLLAGDLEAAAGRLGDAARSLHGDLVFGWRLDMKLRSLQARLALETGAFEDALEVSSLLAKDASAAGVPRYASLAAVLVHRARHALGLPVDLDTVDRDLRQVSDTMAIEGWWWAGETGAALGVVPLIDRAESLAAELAERAGPHGDTLRAHASRRLSQWRATTR